jgi:hypothetical protein
MAAVTERVVVIRQGTVWIEITYDDVTDRMASVTTHNPLPTPIGRVNVWRANTLIIDTAIPVGTITTAIPGNVQRGGQISYRISES